MYTCKQTCCYVNLPLNKPQCNHLNFISGNQLIYNNNVILYAKLIDNIENKCISKPCQVKPKHNQLPYASSFEEVLKMQKAQVVYSNPNYKH